MTRPDEVRTPEHGTLLMVANYRPDVGFAWWLMEHFWVELAAMGRERGLTPLLVFPEDGRVPDTITAAGIETRIQSFRGPGISGWWQAIALVRERRVRAVYFTDRGYSSVFYLILRLLGVRLIVNHDHTPGDRPAIRGLKGALKAAVHRLGVLSCDMQLCVSALIRDRAILNARIPSDRVAVVQNGMEPYACADDPDYAHRALNLPADALLCMTVSRAERYKNIGFAIDVARECAITRARTDVIFVFCGDGPDMAMFQDMARQAGVQEFFVFAGRRTDVPALLCSADLALHPSRGEAFSLAIIEYMSAGLALLVPDIPTVCQAVQHEHSGMIYPATDVSAAADMVCRLADDALLRTRIGAEAARTVERDYSRQGMDAQFRAVFTTLLARDFS